MDEINEEDGQNEISNNINIESLQYLQNEEMQASISKEIKANQNKN